MMLRHIDNVDMNAEKGESNVELSGTNPLATALEMSVKVVFARRIVALTPGSLDDALNASDRRHAVQRQPRVFRVGTKETSILLHVSQGSKEHLKAAVSTAITGIGQADGRMTSQRTAEHRVGQASVGSAMGLFKESPEHWEETSDALRRKLGRRGA